MVERLALPVLLSALAAGPGVAPSVTITSVTPQVSPGGTVSIRAAVSRNTACSASLREPSGVTLTLPRKPTVARRVGWARTLPGNAAAGRWLVIVRCGATGTARASFVVGATTQVQVTVQASGFSRDPASNAIQYGLVLRNQSQTADALRVTVTVTLLDSLGRSLASDTTTVSFIPAGQTFDLGGAVFPNVSLDVAGLKPSIAVAATRAKSLELPPVSNGALATDDMGFQTLTGSVTNPYRTAIPSGATIYAVYFDGQGRILGGDFEEIGANLQPGATVTFTFGSVPVTAAASAQVSIDPCDPLATGCAAVGGP